MGAHSDLTNRLQLTPEQEMFLARQRLARLATANERGCPHVVPVCFVYLNGRFYSPLDEKPKSVEDPRRLARVRDLLRTPDATLLVARWEEDWARLAWLRAYGRGALVEPGSGERGEHATAVAELRAKYPQYGDQRLEARPLIRIVIDRVVTWGDLSAV